VSAGAGVGRTVVRTASSDHTSGRSRNKCKEPLLLNFIFSLYFMLEYNYTPRKRTLSVDFVAYKIQN
jgi:hypothetical protein